MRRRNLIKGVLVILSMIAITMGVFLNANAQDEEEQVNKELLELGKKVYMERCMVCHGKKGDGNGPVNVMRRVEQSGRTIETYPRDFTVGVFKFRTTPTGCLPTDNDLLYIINNGIQRSFMPAHKDRLTEKEKKAVIAYIKTFSDRWEEEEPCDPIPVKKPDWVGTEESIKKGAIVYKKMKCWECHGYDGTGNGPKADLLKDDWGKKIWPFDFTTGELKRGTTPENIYITFTTGLDGTGMPSYEDSLSEEERWHLVSYTLWLMGKTKWKGHIVTKVTEASSTSKAK